MRVLRRISRDYLELYISLIVFMSQISMIIIILLKKCYVQALKYGKYLV
jgi:hypothetical protein